MLTGSDLIPVAGCVLFAFVKETSDLLPMRIYMLVAIVELSVRPLNQRRAPTLLVER